MSIVIEINAVFLAGVRRHHAGTSAIGDDNRIASFGKRVVGQGHRPAENFFGVFCTEGAALADHIVKNDIRTGQRTGMGRGRPGAFFRTAGLDHHHRLFPGGFSDGLDEFFTIPHAFNVHEDDTGGLMITKIIQKIGLINVRFIPDGNDGRQADVFNGSLTDQRQPERAALGDHGQVTRRDIAGDERGV